MRAVAMLAIAMLALTACSGARERLDASTAAVLVPADETFRSAWGFTLDESADNYTARSHWDPSFNPDINPELMTESYQINDPGNWSAEGLSDDPAVRDAFVIAAETGGEHENCESVNDEPVVYRCRFTDGNGREIPLLVRRFADSTPPTVMVVLGHGAASIDYISGTFEPVPPSGAEGWFTG